MSKSHRKQRWLKKSGSKEKSKQKDDRNSFRGEIQKNRKGFAFIISKDPTVKDAYVSPKHALGLSTGDTVEFTLKNRGRFVSANIVKILSRAKKSIVGQSFFDDKEQGFLATPEDDFQIVNPEKVRPDEFYIADIVDYPTARNYGKVQIVESLGSQLTPEEDIKVVEKQFQLPHQFSPHLESEIKQCQQDHLQELSSHSRRDLTRLPIVTIDGEDAKDFDDAILVTRAQSKEEGYVLYVSIADVGFFVKPHSRLDEEAYLRGTSIYFPGICIPMLPQALSNQLCSLVPDESRLCLTVEIHFDSAAKVLKTHFYESIIKNQARLTYQTVQNFFDNPEDSKLSETVRENLLNAQSLYFKLAEDRKRRGVLDFDLGESKIMVDSLGVPLNIEKAARYDSHKLIEEFMIAANQAVAKHLKQQRIPSVYRVHEAPDPQCQDEINPFLQSLNLSERIEQITPHEFSCVLAATHGLPAAPVIHKLILRSQKQAVYSSEPLGHFGLALKDYTHFTSPIRRYPDLLVHRALRQLIHRSKKTDKFSENLEEMAQSCSQKERRAVEAERFMLKRKQCWFLLERIGEVFKGKLNWPTKAGAFVELDPFFIEGFLPIESLGGFFQFDEKNFCLRKRPGKQVLKIGDLLEVRLEDVDIETGEITFSLAHNGESTDIEPQKSSQIRWRKDLDKPKSFRDESLMNRSGRKASKNRHLSASETREKMASASNKGSDLQKEVHSTNTRRKLQKRKNRSTRRAKGFQSGRKNRR